MIRLLVALLVCMTARIAGAHFTPILPSVCTPDIALAGVTGTPTGSAVAPGAADALRIQWDAAGNDAVFCPADPADPTNVCAAPQPRAFTLGDATGTLTLPSRFTANVFASGDVASADVPIVFASGGESATIPVTLTTGLAVAGDTVVEGASVAPSGTLMLVGVADVSAVLPAAHDIVVRLTCVATPAPDIDQFQELTQATVGGAITPRRATIHAVLTGDPSETLQLDAAPAMVRLHSGDATIASFLASGLTARGRRFSAQSADGSSRITVRPRRRGRYVIALRLGGVTMPAEAGGRVLVDLVLDLGGVLARGERLFVGNRRRLHAA